MASALQPVSIKELQESSTVFYSDVEPKGDPFYSRIEHLANAIYLNRWKECFVAMFTVYFDASGHPDGLDVLSVAGFIADAVQWKEFERNWNEILKRSDFQVSGLHMREFCHSTGEFALWKGDEQRRRNFLTALIGTIKARVRHSFAHSMYMPDYREVDKQYKLSETIAPLAYCGCNCIAKVGAWALKWGIPQSDLVFAFEDGDKDRNNLAAEAHRVYGVNVQFMKKTQSVAFQAADLLAYEHFRANQKVVPNPGAFALNELRNPLQRLIEIPNGENSADWSITDKTNLEQFCVEQKIPESWP
jgi:hypothetical protein